MKSCIIGRGQEVLKFFLFFFGPDFFYLGLCMAQTLIDMSPDWFDVQVLINFFQLRCRDPMKAKPS